MIGMLFETAFRTASAEDAAAIVALRRHSIAGLATTHYLPEQISAWIGDRTQSFYEAVIAKGNMVVAHRDGVILGFVEAEPGEVTRLFVLPEAAGAGLGRSLLAIGVERARAGQSGPVRLTATLNAEGFYRRHGFQALRREFVALGLIGDPIEIVHMEQARPKVA